MKKETSLSEKAIGACIAIPIIGLLTAWDNHVLVQYPLHWWQYLLLGLGQAVIGWSVKWTRYILNTVFILVVTGQILSWCQLIHLPLFHFVPPS